MPEIRLEPRQYSYGHNTYYHSPDLSAGIGIRPAYSFADALIIDIRSFEKISISMFNPSNFTSPYDYRIRLSSLDLGINDMTESHFTEIPEDASGNQITETAIQPGKVSEYTLLNLFHGKKWLMLQVKGTDSLASASGSVACT